MNITYEDVFNRNTAVVNNKTFNREFYDKQADDYRLTSERKQDYYLGLIERDRKVINKCINNNRDLKMLLKNIKLALTTLKMTHQIVDFNLIMPSNVGNLFEGEDGTCDWNDINGRNWDMVMVEMFFLPIDTQSMKNEMHRMQKQVEILENKGKNKSNIERNENESG